MKDLQDLKMALSEQNCARHNIYEDQGIWCNRATKMVYGEPSIIQAELGVVVWVEVGILNHQRLYIEVHLCLVIYQM